MTALSAVKKEVPRISTLRNLLVAVDPLCDTERLLAVAAGLGKRFQSKVTLMHVIQEKELDLAEPAQHIAVRAQGERGVRECADLMRIHQLPCHTLVQVGDIVREVGRVVREKDIDLVIVGSAGFHGLQKVRLGSVAEGILRSVGCPVLTVGPDVPRPVGEVQFRKILFPVTFEVDIESACQHLEPIAAHFGAHVVVMHTLPPATRFGRKGPELAARYQARLEELMPCGGRPFTSDYVVKFGAAAEAILELANTWEADLIALPVRRAGRMASRLPGHVAYEVIRQARCPVLTIRS